MTQRPSLPLPSGRFTRLSHFGRLAVGVAGGLVGEGVRRWQRGEPWDWQQQALSPNNLERISERLSQMRGAAMKLGQLLSMDAGHLLPAELSGILAGLRNHAHTLPLAQLEPLLSAAWGADWPASFQRFSYQPIAAASIGQVHEAWTTSGRHLAIKVQYPGVVESIDHDLDQVATLLRWSRLLPKDLDITPLLAEAKAQLQQEADYQHEAQQLHQMRQQLAMDPDFLLPELDTDLSHTHILAMDFIPGVPIDQLASASAEARHYWVEKLFRLLLRELFEWHQVQTDPNFANYLIDLKEQRLGLIDFGAARAYPVALCSAYQRLLHALISQDDTALLAAARQIGYCSAGITPEQEECLLQLFQCVGRTLHGPYAFAQSDLVKELQQLGMRLSFELGYWYQPPLEALLLHRKLAGLFLLAQRMQVTMDVGALAAPYLHPNQEKGVTPAPDML
ncbi:ABC1 kinase family protein [Marinospirillum sp.]|uniref:ABC1 kinase family protein n=1 Tax=Marinospirillum sp. TaxID=2183934 RepID=UPI003A85974C